MPFGVENLPGDVLNFMDRAFLQGENGISANVVVASDDAVRTNITILADIDVFRPEELSVPVEMDEIDAILSQLRKFKNEIFFSIFTEQAIKHYE